MCCILYSSKFIPCCLHQFTQIFQPLPYILFVRDLCTLSRNFIASCDNSPLYCCIRLIKVMRLKLSFGFSVNYWFVSSFPIALESSTVLRWSPGCHQNYFYDLLCLIYCNTGKISFHNEFPLWIKLFRSVVFDQRCKKVSGVGACGSGLRLQYVWNCVFCCDANMSIFNGPIFVESFGVISLGLYSRTTVSSFSTANPPQYCLWLVCIGISPLNFSVDCKGPVSSSHGFLDGLKMYRISLLFVKTLIMQLL